MASVKVTVRAYGGRSGEERAAGRREELVEAAFALVAENGWRALSIDALCRRAGLNKRYFYESFGGLDDVIAAVTRKLSDDAITVTLAAIEPCMSPQHAIRAAIAAFIAHLTDDPRRARVLFGAVPAGDAAAGHRAAAIRRVIGAVSAQGRGLYALRQDPVVELSAAMIVGGTSQSVLDWLDGRICCSREALVDHLFKLWQAIGETTIPLVRNRGSATQPRPS